MREFADQRVVTKTPATLTVGFVDQDGEPANPAGAVTVAVTRADGTVLKAAGTATTTVDPPQGTRTVALTAAENDRLDRLTCVWTAASGETVTTHVDVVGGYYFTLGELRKLDGMNGLPAADLRVARQMVEEMVEERTGWVWVPRLAVETIQANVGVRLSQHPVRRIRAVSVDGVADVAANWYSDTYGILSPIAGWTYTTSPVSSSLTVAYEVGEDRPPIQLTSALIDAARQGRLDRTNGISQRTTSITNDVGGTTSYARATVRDVFGMPAVDAVLAFWDRGIPGTA